MVSDNPRREEEEEKRCEEDKNGIKNVAHSSWRKRFEVGSRAAHDARTMREALVARQATSHKATSCESNSNAAIILRQCCEKIAEAQFVRLRNCWMRSDKMRRTGCSEFRRRCG